MLRFNLRTNSTVHWNSPFGSSFRFSKQNVFHFFSKSIWIKYFQWFWRLSSIFCGVFHSLPESIRLISRSQKQLDIHSCIYIVGLLNPFWHYKHWISYCLPTGGITAWPETLLTALRDSLPRSIQLSDPDIRASRIIHFSRWFFSGSSLRSNIQLC